jgi:glycosyltransferase involved in cell wall biosynthesis
MSDSAYAHTFTVFTSTYNRANTLERLFRSLQRQTFRDFEWLVVDDGSTDATKDLFAEWSSAGFPIRYIRQENAGKHVAFNRGVREARGELFLNVDSDDELVQHALARFKHHWDAIPSQERDRFTAVTSLCQDSQGNVLGDRFPDDVMDSDSLELYFKVRVRGDKFGFHRTDVLREHPFPEPPGMKFLAEGIVWFAIARGHRTRFVNECLQIVHADAQRSGQRLSRLTRSTAAGRRFFHQALLNDYVDWLATSPMLAATSLVNYARYSLAVGVGLSAQVAAIRSTACKLALVCLAPLGYGLHLKDRLGGLR